MVQSKTTRSLNNFLQLVESKWQDFKSFEPTEIVTIENLYTKRIGKINEYSEGIIGMGYSSEYLTKEEYYWIDSIGYLKRLSEKYPLIDECVLNIEKEFKLTHDKAISSFISLMNFILFKNELILDNGRIQELITVFINDLNGSPPLWTIKLWIDGIWLGDYIIEISDETTIRRPVDKDYEFVEHADGLMQIMNKGLPQTSSAIIEISKRFKNEIDAEKYITKIKQALALYNLGSVIIKKREYKVNSILFNTGMIIDNEISSHHKYEVRPEDASDLNSFMEYMSDFLPDNNWQSSNNDLNPLYISIERYFDAILKSMSIENKITTTITALEALYLKGNERSELSHKLSQRVSYISKYFGVSPLKIYKTLKRAYEIRSTYIHGSMLPPEERNDLTDVSNDILLPLRYSILVFVELSAKFNKDAIILKIDNSILDEGAHNKFSKEFNKLSLLKWTKGNTGFKHQES